MTDTLRSYVEDLGAPDTKDDEVFRQLLARGVALLHLLDREIAHEFEVSRPTVTRWRNGSNAPHPAMRKHVYAWLRERASVMAKREAQAAPSGGGTSAAPLPMAARHR